MWLFYIEITWHFCLIMSQLSHESHDKEKKKVIIKNLYVIKVLKGKKTGKNRNVR